jgi:hypothetical protein
MCGGSNGSTTFAGVIQDGGINNSTGGSLAITGGAQTLAGTNNGSTTFAGVIQDGGINNSTGGSLAITGDTQTLTGTNTYTGGTAITGGTLALSGTGSIANSSGVNLATGTTFDISQTTAGATITTLGNTAAGQTGIVSLGGQTLTISNGSTTFAANWRHASSGQAVPDRQFWGRHRVRCGFACGRLRNIDIGQPNSSVLRERQPHNLLGYC